MAKIVFLLGEPIPVLSEEANASTWQPQEWAMPQAFQVQMGGGRAPLLRRIVIYKDDVS